ncbi:unnamed protein product [Cuscuta europaea]|uniref:Uncharacterized protein n=1 Tax=Cuscuta europaea TaxID=41803 RepID=A0A9P0ZFW6_CUSEU|nr:unnamed protein product [Cuscuta europaea]
MSGLPNPSAASSTALAMAAQPPTDIPPVPATGLTCDFHPQSGSSSMSSSSQQVSMPIGLPAAQTRSPLAASLSQRLHGIPPLDSYRIFNMLEPFTWAPSLTAAPANSLPPPPVFQERGSSSPLFSSPTFSGQPGVAPLPHAVSSSLPDFNSPATFFYLPWLHNWLFLPLM